MTRPTVTRNDELGRYELHTPAEGSDETTVAGFAAFDQETGSARFTHTEIDPAFRGRGYGETLVSDALSDVARRGDEIVPLCPFVAAYLRDNEIAGAVVRWPDGAPHDAATPGEQPA